MKLFIKKYRFIYVLIISIIILAGCGRSHSNGINSDKNTSATGGVEKIRVWTDNAHEKELRLRQIEVFNNTIGKEKGIEIEYTVFGSNYQDVIKAAAKNGEAPELFRPTVTFIMDFVDANYMIPISDLPGGEEMILEYEDSLVTNLNIFNENVYTLPYNLNSYKLIVNNELFDKAGIKEYPKTWEDVREVAKKITETGKGKFFGWGLGLQSPWTISTYLIRPNGCNVGHVGFNHETMKFEFAAFTPVIETVKNMIDDGSVFPGFEGLDGDSLRAQFAEGRIGMIPGASFDVSVYNDQFPANFDWSVIPVPAFDDGGSPYKEFTEAISLLGIGIAAEDKKEKTMEVFKFFYSDAYAAEMYENSLYIPAREQVIELADKKPAKKGFEEFAFIPDMALMLPLPDIRIPLGGVEYRQIIGNIFAGVYDHQDVRKVLEDLDSHYNNALEKLPEEILKEYQHPQEVIDNFKR